MALSFSSSLPLQEKILKNRTGEPAGIYSICSTNRFVIQTAMRLQRKSDEPLLIESTCNQVNQEGGYTGLTPAGFSEYVRSLAREVDFPTQRIILGGDHLGPNPWKKAPAAVAQKKAQRMVHDYVEAGYTKLHLDTSMACADENLLPPETIAGRSAELCRVAEETSSQRDQEAPVYVIGTEVPTPGGLTAQQTGIHVTSAGDAENTIDIHQRIFSQNGLSSALQRVIAIVVSPGVEFSDRQIYPYNPGTTIPLSRLIEKQDNMVYEAHSTDYQAPDLLRRMVQDHFAILKVGPALTFAFREAIFRLAAIEKELPGLSPESQSHILETLLNAMHAEPSHWIEHYSGSADEIDFELKYSYSDRIRYYWSYPAVQTALGILLRNLQDGGIPPTLVSQYFPGMLSPFGEHPVCSQPIDLIDNCIARVLLGYQHACGYAS